MKVYCINLDRRPDRLEHMQDQFDRLGLGFERIAAVDGMDPGVARVAGAIQPGIFGRKISAAAYGCFQSHRLAWARLLASGESHAMVLEDDLLLAPGIVAYRDPGWIPDDADLIKLETTLNRVHRDRRSQTCVAGRNLYRLRSRHTGTGGYVISASAARWLLDATKEIRDAVDETLFNPASPLFDRLVIYQMDPAPIAQGARKGLSKAGWSMSSIASRFAPGEGEGMGPPGGPASRVLDRLREEVRALVNGTYYVVVPFG